MNNERDLISAINLQELPELLRRRRRLALLIFLATVLISVAVTTMAKPKYTATAVIEYRPKSAQSAVLGQLMATFGDQPERTLATQAELLTTRPVLEKALRAARSRLSPDQLKGSTRVAVSTRTNLITLTVTRRSSQEAPRLVNAMASAFLESSRQAAAEDIARAKNQVAYKILDTEEDILRLSEAMGQQPPDSENTRQLRSRLDLATTIYGTLREKHEQLGIIEQLASSLRLAAQATGPNNPISPNLFSGLVLGCFAGLIFAGGGLLAAERLDNTVKTSENAQAALGLPSLGEIPMMPGLKLAPPASLVSESFRNLRTNIKFCGLDREVKTILVTSPQAGDGKTVVTANLAAILAYAGHKVIAVDCDLRHPNLHAAFKGADSESGVTTCLAGKTMDCHQKLQASGVKNLSLLLSGTIPPNPSELLSSEKMAGLLGQLRGAADFLIIDSPPAGLVTDAAVLARQVDGVLVVLSEKSTRRESAKRTINSLRQIGAPLLGIIMNKTTSADSYYYYPGYGNREDSVLPQSAADQSVAT